jgi:zinc protease
MRRLAWQVYAATLIAPLTVGAQQAPVVKPLAFTRFVLPNGLVALFNEDHSSPIVSVGVWYHVGAKDEPVGKTGLAHLCEHMMFEGSPNVAPGEFQSTIKTGGGNSEQWGETSEDRTFYFQTVPTTLLETTLWLESDRMMAPFTAEDSSRLAAARGAIRNERLQKVENRPFGSAETIVAHIMYGPEHPYRGGLEPMDDLNRASLADMRQFCAPYYVPNNAIVALSGDFDPKSARAMVERYFGSIKRGATVTHPVMRPALTAERRIVLEDPRGRTPSVRIIWPGAGFGSPDKGALRAAASVLTGNRTSGLVKALLYDRQLATFVVAANIDVENGGFFQIQASPRANTPLGLIEDVIDSVVHATLAAQPSDAQLRRFKNADADTAITSLQGRWARIDTLSQGESWAGDPVAYAKQVNATAKLTPADVQRVATRYLTSKRIVLSMVPAGKLDLISKPERPYENASALLPAEVKR